MERLLLLCDYAHGNYVLRKPEDKGVKLTPPNLGVYDEYVGLNGCIPPSPRLKICGKRLKLPDVGLMKRLMTLGIVTEDNKWMDVMIRLVLKKTWEMTQ